MDHALNSGITLLLGGARSGKSVFGEQLLENSGLKPVYLATGRAFDDEMDERIEKHRNRRGDQWQTIEEPLAIANALEQADQDGQAILVDCLTLWVTNLMMAKANIEIECSQLIAQCKALSSPVVFVSNEVGLGIVPENQMAREFRDHAGYVNAQIAAASEQAYFVAAGLPLRLK